jgi:hypothetical protein
MHGRESTSDAESPIGGTARASAGATIAAPIVILRLRDPSYTERLASFLDSVGLSAVVAGPGAVELTAALPGRAPDADELEIYLRVWRVLEPDAVVDVEP